MFSDPEVVLTGAALSAWLETRSQQITTPKPQRMAIKLASELGQKACSDFLSFMIVGGLDGKPARKKRHNSSVAAEMLRHFLKLSYRRREEIHDLLMEHRPGVWERIEKELERLVRQQEEERKRVA